MVFHRRGAARVALVGDNASDLHIPVELQECVGSLAIRLGDNSELSVEIAALGRLLVSCRNASYLEITGRSILGLSTHIPHPLLNIRTVFINVSPSQPAEEIASLVNRMPHLERALLLPDTPSPLPSGSLIPQHRLRELTLMGAHMSLLPLFITTCGRTVRRLTLWFSEDSKAQLERVTWPSDASESMPNIDVLRLMLAPGAPRDSAARLVSCCSAARRIEINDMARALGAVLPAVLQHCPGLRVLVLRFAPSAARAQLRAICSLLAAAFPRTLRELVLRVRIQGDWDGFEEIRQLCRARRVGLAISSS